MKRNSELKVDRCPTCNGKGTVITDDGGFNAEVTCSECKGTGVVNDHRCTICQGRGTVTVKVTRGKVKYDKVALCDHCNGSGFEPTD